LGPGCAKQLIRRVWRLSSARNASPIAPKSACLRYKNLVIEPAYRVDFLIEGWLVVEVKAVASIIPIHVAQVVTYLRLLKSRQGLIMNFNVRRLKDGVKSVIAKDVIVDPEPAIDSAVG